MLFSIPSGLRRQTSLQPVEPEEPEPSGGTSEMARRVKLGFLGGLIATVSMTVFRLPTSRSLPPTAEFWAQYVGEGEATAYPGIGLLLHLLYGAASGVAFAAIAPGRAESDAMAETKAATTGTLYGIALSVFGSRVVLRRLLGIELDTDEGLVFHISHVVYGLTLGTWVGSRLADETP